MDTPNSVEIYLIKLIDLEQYKLLLSSDTYYLWNQLLQIINYTKSYNQGKEIALILMTCFEKFKNNFSEEEQGKQLILIYSLYFNMLDKLDFWDEYLQNWELIRKKSIDHKLCIGIYDQYSKESHFTNGAKEYLIEETTEGFKLSFLYSISHRKKIIENKLVKSKKSKRVKNLLHEQQSDLTIEEIKERYDWMIKFFKTGTYDFSPPASRQKEKRRNKNSKMFKLDN